MNLFNTLRGRKAKDNATPRGEALHLVSEHAPCTCPEPCERDHGNE